MSLDVDVVVPGELEEHAKEEPSSASDVIVIGGGPAGLTAAIYASRANLRTLLLDKELPGGQLNDTTEVENFPGFADAIQGPELMERTRRQAERLGTKILMAEAIDVEWNVDGADHLVITPEGQLRAPVVIIGTGAGPIELPAKGAQEFKGKGLSYCAVCDGYFFRGKTLLEIGAGDAGFTETLFLTKFADEIRMVVRHGEDDPQRFKAKDRMLVQKVMENPKVQFMWNTEVDEIRGDGQVDAVVLRNLESGELMKQEIDGVFVNIGHSPATEFLQGKLEMDERGYLHTDMRTRTRVPGVFGIGDVRTFSGEYAQAVIGASDGCIAALEAEKYLEDRAWPFGK